jgi:hypothetical protein
MLSLVKATDVSGAELIVAIVFEVGISRRYPDGLTGRQSAGKQVGM